MGCAPNQSNRTIFNNGEVKDYIFGAYPGNLHSENVPYLLTGWYL